MIRHTVALEWKYHRAIKNIKNNRQNIVRSKVARCLSNSFVIFGWKLSSRVQIGKFLIKETMYMVGHFS